MDYLSFINEQLIQIVIDKLELIIIIQYVNELNDKAIKYMEIQILE